MPDPTPGARAAGTCSKRYAKQSQPSMFSIMNIALAINEYFDGIKDSKPMKKLGNKPASLLYRQA